MQTAWFWILCALWSLYFVTEGFDFGVGMLLPVLGRSEDDRRTMLQAIGPFWDGNEVWLIIAGAATFAAFPVWYATMFSGFYVALLLVLVLLIVRVVSFEWRGKAESRALARRLDVAQHDRLGRPPADLGHRALEPAPRRPDLVRAGVHRHVLGSLHAVHGRRRNRVRAPLRAPRRRLPDAPHDRRPARPRRPHRRAARAARRGRRRRVPRLDARRRDPERTTRASSPASSSSSLAAVDRGRRRRAHAPAARGARLRRHRRHDRARRRAAVHRALPARDGLLDRLRRQPHDHERLVGPLHARP